MTLLRKTYTIDGDDRSPRAYLEGVSALIAERIADKEAHRDHCDTATEKRLAGREIDGLTEARTIVDDVLAGLEDTTS